MPTKIKCKCGSPDVVYIVQKGRRKNSEAFCGNCLPVEPVEENKNVAKPMLAETAIAAMG